MNGHSVVSIRNRLANTSKVIIKDCAVEACQLLITIQMMCRLRLPCRVMDSLSALDISTPLLVREEQKCCKSSGCSQQLLQRMSVTRLGMDYFMVTMSWTCTIGVNSSAKETHFIYPSDGEVKICGRFKPCSQFPVSHTQTGGLGSVSETYRSVHTQLTDINRLCNLALKHHP